jgi:hypothetical protein
MKEKEISKRLEKAEHSLTLQQALLVAMDKAIARFESLSECDAWLRDHPGELLLGDSEQVLSAFSKRLEKEPPQVVLKDVARNLRRRVLLAGLWRDSNRYVADVTDHEVLLLALMARKLEALVGRSDFSVCSGSGKSPMPRRQRALRPARISSVVTSGGAPEARNCGNEIAQLFGALLRTQFAIETISARYFDGHAVLFKEYDNKLREQVDVAEALVSLYNKLLDLPHPPGECATGGAQDPPSRIDVDEVKRAAKDSSEAVVESLINGVKSDMRAGLAGAKRAREIFTASLRNP